MASLNFSVYINIGMGHLWVSETFNFSWQRIHEGLLQQSAYSVPRQFFSSRDTCEGSMTLNADKDRRAYVTWQQVSLSPCNWVSFWIGKVLSCPKSL